MFCGFLELFLGVLEFFLGASEFFLGVSKLFQSIAELLLGAVSAMGNSGLLLEVRGMASLQCGSLSEQNCRSLAFPFNIGADVGAVDAQGKASVFQWSTTVVAGCQGPDSLSRIGRRGGIFRIVVSPLVETRVTPQAAVVFKRLAAFGAVYHSEIMARQCRSVNPPL